MRHVARDCCADRRGLSALRSLIVSLAVGVLLLAGSGGARADVAVHVEVAETQSTPDGTFGPVRPGIAARPGDWARVTLPHHQQRSVLPDTRDGDMLTAWYRVEVPAAAHAALPQGLWLYVPRWQTIGQVAVYADDVLIYRSHAGPVWNGFNHPLWLSLGAGSDAKPPKHVHIRVDHMRGAGLALSSVWLGDEEGLAQRRWWREWIQAEIPYLLSAAFLFFGFFALTVWIRRREPIYGLFFLCSALIFARNLHFHLGLEPLLIPEDWFGWMTISSLSWLMVVAYAFCFRLHSKRYVRTERVLIGMLALATLVGLPPVAALPQLERILPLAYLFLIAGAILTSSLGLWAALRSDSMEAKILASWNVTNIAFGVHDWMLQNYHLDIEGVYLLPYHAIMMVIMFLYVVQKRYLGALRQVEQVNVNLEIQLRAKEEELRKSYVRLRGIETQQALSLERQRLMGEMHDGVGSSLMVALKTAESSQATAVAEVLRECIDDLRLAIDSLEPVQSDLLLLLATLRFRLGTRLEQAGLHLLWEVEDISPLDWLDASSSLQILRIVQEVLNNVLKHSGADSVTLKVFEEGESVLVQVRDNGRGFDAAQSTGAGRGLASIRRRAAAIGGLASWSTDGAGTCFELRLPKTAPETKAQSEPQAEASADG